MADVGGGRGGACSGCGGRPTPAGAPPRGSGAGAWPRTVATPPRSPLGPLGRPRTAGMCSPTAAATCRTPAGARTGPGWGRSRR
eukprot:4444204-Alexandrium_andersonii.AAC.1